MKLGLIMQIVRVTKPIETPLSLPTRSINQFFFNMNTIVRNLISFDLPYNVKKTCVNWSFHWILEHVLIVKRIFAGIFEG